MSLESRLLIEDARASYDALTKEQKELVKQLDTLEAAEKKYQELKEQADKEEIDKAEAASVDKLIETIGEVTLDSGETIEAARAAYNALTDEQKSSCNRARRIESRREQVSGTERRRG